jgi:glycine dehydrogenase
MAPFLARHLGNAASQTSQMLAASGASSLGSLMEEVIPAPIRLPDALQLPGLDSALSEQAALDRLRDLMGTNHIMRSLIGLGYHDCLTPHVIQRNVLENPGWYTAYTPYQAEIAQGRLEALLHFQTMVADLTGLPVANASLLDEGTAAAEAISLCAHFRTKAHRAFLSDQLHPHVIDVIKTRASPLDIEITVGDITSFDPQLDSPGSWIAAVLACPDTLGQVWDPSPDIARIKAAGPHVIACADLLALTLIKPPGEQGADVCVGTSQRFGVPLGFGGPHAAFMAVREDFTRKLPGRLVGLSVDAAGQPACRLALQTREQHIRRDKATSNICTAQVLLAVIAACYAIYHGPDGLRQIARHCHALARSAAEALRRSGRSLAHNSFFDTLTINALDAPAVVDRARSLGLNLRLSAPDQVTLAFDETCSEDTVSQVVAAFADKPATPITPGSPDGQAADQSPGTPLAAPPIPPALARTSPFLSHPTFHQHHSESAMLRYLRRLQGKDIALDRSMIPLGSCTMKLNATAEMMPLSWPSVNRIHPFAPLDQAPGYLEMFRQLEAWLAAATGMAAVSLQPNAGSQGEYAGLLAIQRYHRQKGEPHRTACLIPTSAHGTNPASAVMAGLSVVPVKCDARGDVDLADLQLKAAQHADHLSCLMITYPSTHGVFEDQIQEVCQTIHDHGGQVYMDGANLNAQLGLTSPGLIGADVCHLNLHKTFCIPHGGGGPGVGPIAVQAHLAPFLPGHSQLDNPEGAICSAPWGSASICTISWMYIAMVGAEGLTAASEHAILAANYIAARLDPYYPILYRGQQGRVAHECILDLRQFKLATVEDVAKRLMDFGFHAPTMSWPVPGTLMVEPTESEPLEEIDRFCEAMIAIRQEIAALESGEVAPAHSPLKHAPHTAAAIAASDWPHPYSREQAAFPLPHVRTDKYWPPVARIDNVHGDRNLVCTCPPMDAYNS